ncbi:MAG: tetratricopeptide repeat protein [Planctomyces sp.]|nr:tetratricopeptide repeat protein [Planctomyces sp.]
MTDMDVDSPTVHDERSARRRSVLTCAGPWTAASVQSVRASWIRTYCVHLFRPLTLTFLSGLLSLSGCQTLSRDSETGMFDMTEYLNIDRIRGPLERGLNSELTPLELGRKYSPEAEKKLKDALALYDQKNYKAAAKMYKKIAKEFEESSYGEEAQYRLGECYYAMGDLPEAQESFDQLFEDYPSTRYVEPTTRRLFAIARQWLEVSDPVARNEIRQVSGERVVEEESSPPAASKDPTIRYRIIPNFHDGSRPMFDTQGRALQALKSIWLNDPVGPLADDSLMLTATYYQRRKNYLESDRYFKILREEYPNSPHIEEAYVLGSHVKLMSYQGPYYEGTNLEGARKLKEQSLHLFPASSARQQIRKDLQRVYLLEAEKAWAYVDYWNRQGETRAVALACIRLITEYPDTPQAADARKLIKTLDPAKLQGLPEVPEFIRSLPASEPIQKPSEPETRPRVKSVSSQSSEDTPVQDSRGENSESGRVRL